jgi:hypothetical protein
MSWFILADSALFFYVAIPIGLLVLCYLVEGAENIGLATVGLVITLTTLQVFSDVHPLSYIVNDPLRSLVIAAVYIALGVAYVWFKWTSYTRMAARKIASVLKSDSSNDLVYAIRVSGYRSIPLKVSDHKSKIMGWMAYWPISAAWTVLNDSLRRLFEVIYDRIAVSLQRISDRAFADLTK